MNLEIYPNLKYINTDIPNFKNNNKYHINLQIIGPKLNKILCSKKSGGFTTCLMNLLDNY